MTREQMAYVLATGYGRNSLEGIADHQMSELSCHAKGPASCFPTCTPSSTSAART